MSSHDLSERAMSNSPVSTPSSSISDETGATEIEPQWPSKGQQYNNIGEKSLNPAAFRRKVKRQDDGLLAICCEWIVQHQVGKFFYRYPTILIRGIYIASFRTFCESPRASRPYTYLFSTRQTTHAQILRIVLLQPRVKRIHCRLG